MGCVCRDAVTHSHYYFYLEVKNIRRTLFAILMSFLSSRSVTLFALLIVKLPLLCAPGDCNGTAKSYRDNYF